MRMSIDEAIHTMEYYDKCHIRTQRQAREKAVGVMQKYQKIQEIINSAKDSDGAVKYNWLYEQIKEVVEDDNT